MQAQLRQTPLHAWHVAHGGRMVPFGGWSMPVQYPSGILAEHRAVRAGVGLFDISHMGRVEVEGPDALELLQRTTTNDVALLDPMRAHYALLCDANGGILDDLIIYRLEDRFLVVVNASNRERDFAWWCDQRERWHLNVQLRDRTLDLAMLAVQGPGAEGLLQPLTKLPVAELRYYAALRGNVAGFEVLLARTGYTGEDGFELMLSSDLAVQVWECLVGLAKPLAPAPAGLGARDTLRLEAGLPLYGHELSLDVTPLEAGLDRFVKLGKSDFVGLAALRAHQAAGLRQRLIGFEMVDSGIPRHEYPVCADGARIGSVTSGNYGPSVGRPIGMAYVPPACAEIGTEIGIVVRDREARARVVPRPFWKHRTKRFPPQT
jgi:aminomethyltransferase